MEDEKWTRYPGANVMPFEIESYGRFNVSGLVAALGVNGTRLSFSRACSRD